MSNAHHIEFAIRRYPVLWDKTHTNYGVKEATMSAKYHIMEQFPFLSLVRVNQGISHYRRKVRFLDKHHGLVPNSTNNASTQTSPPKTPDRPTAVVRPSIRVKIRLQRANPADAPPPQAPEHESSGSSSDESEDLDGHVEEVLEYFEEEGALEPPKSLRHAFKCTHCDFSDLYEETCSTMCDEDCLHLNLFMPLSSNQTCAFPVMMWIQESGSRGPDFLIDEDIILVSVSYRTHILGFLNTEDDFASGNMGAKDILAALKWVRDYIYIFNGDSTAVTVFGSGKGATLVASLLASNAADDLYRRVIIQSGSALSPADYRSYSFDIVNKLYWNLNGPFEKFNRTKLYELLAKASAQELLSASEDLFDSTEVRDNQRLINSFGPTVEKTKHAFAHKLPVEVYKSRMTNNVAEVMIGYTNLESLYKLKGLVKSRKVLKYLNYNFQYLLPFEGAVDEYGSKRYRRILRKIMEFYFVNGTIGERSLRRYAKYVSDQVIYPLIRQARLHAEASCGKLYLYRFPYKGALNVAWFSSVGNLNLSGATFGDEICYLFRCKSANEVYNSGEGSNERHFIKKIARLWTNFAKYGNPTPDDDDHHLGSLRWEPLIDEVPLRALNLGRKIKMVNIPEEKRVRFWDELRQEFFPEKTWRDEL